MKKLNDEDFQLAAEAGNTDQNNSEIELYKSIFTELNSSSEKETLNDQFSKKVTAKLFVKAEKKRAQKENLMVFTGITSLCGLIMLWVYLDNTSRFNPIIEFFKQNQLTVLSVLLVVSLTIFYEKIVLGFKKLLNS